ncbi:MAG: hypothetical protein AB1714_08095 [Acidobacteriota bacterium]
MAATLSMAMAPGPLAGQSDSGLDPCALIDRSPFGIHPAFAFDIPGDPYRPAREAGVTWTRCADAPYVFWALVDPERTGDPAKMRFAGTTIGPDGKPMYFDYDSSITKALASGLSVMWNIAVEPSAWGYSKPGSWQPIDEGAYRRFVQTTIRRYPGVRVWQVGNEPDIQLGFPPEPKLADFAKLHKLTYGAIKEADPGVVVVMGGAADWPLGFFDAVLDELDGSRVDVFDFHLYGDPKGGTLSPRPLPPIGYMHVETQARSIRKHLDARGFSRTRVWSTECGTFSGTVGLGPAMMTATEADQARDLVKRFVVALASGVEKVFWAFGISEGLGSWEDHDYFDHTGLIYTGHGAPAGTRKLGYWALWKMTGRLRECSLSKVEKVATGVPRTRAYRFTKPGGGSIMIAWWDTFLVPGYKRGDKTTLTLPWTASTAVARPAVPDAARGADVDAHDPESAFPATKLTPVNRKVGVTLGPDPIWITTD